MAVFSEAELGSIDGTTWLLFSTFSFAGGLDNRGEAAGAPS